MKISRRSALGALAGAFPAAHLRRAAAQEAAPAIEKGPFQGTRESLQAYRVPEWFRDAKFGIWAHWGPQSAAEDGDWYARNMYMQGSAQYKYPPGALRPSVQGRLQGRDPHLQGRSVGARAPDGPLPEGRRQIFRQHGRAPRQLRHVELEVPAALERGQIGPEEGHRRNLEAGGPQARAAVRRERAPLEQLRLVRHSARQRQDRRVRGRSLRRHRRRLSPTSITSYKDMPADFAQTAQAMGRVAPDSWKTAVFQPHQGSRRPASARPALHRWRHPLRGIRPEPGGAPLQRERQAPSRQSRGGLHQQAARGLRDRHLRARSRARHRRTRSGPIPGRPIPASATGTTRKASSTRRPRR